MKNDTNMSQIKQYAIDTFNAEADAIRNLSNLLTDDFDQAVEAILVCTGKVVVTGMGKSGIIGKKIAATLASTGTPAFFLHPGELALAVTYESVTLPADLVGWLDGRSSLARLGLMVHVTAHRIDPGWSGCIVLEFYNSGKLPLALRPGMLIGALSFEPLSGPAARPYNRREDAKYRNQQGAVASRIDKD